MQKILLVIVLGLLFSCQEKTASGAVAMVANTGITTDATMERTFELQFTELLNNHRKQMGLKEITHHPRLAEIARTHSINMANKSVTFGHTGFSGRCSEGREILGGANLCSENVAMGQSTPQKTFQSWLDSPSHRENMEEPRHTHTGLGFKKTSNGTYYWTQILLEKI